MYEITDYKYFFMNYFKWSLYENLTTITWIDVNFAKWIRLILESVIFKKWLSSIYAM